MEWARPRGDPRSWHWWAQTARELPRSGRGQPVRRRGDPTAARNVRSSARGCQGDSEADGPRPFCRWTGALLVVLVKPPPISTSDRRAIPILTPGYHFPCRHPGGTQMAPGGPFPMVAWLESLVRRRSRHHTGREALRRPRRCAAASRTIKPSLPRPSCALTFAPCPWRGRSTFHSISSESSSAPRSTFLIIFLPLVGATGARACARVCSRAWVRAWRCVVSCVRACVRGALWCADGAVLVRVRAPCFHLQAHAAVGAAAGRRRRPFPRRP